MPNLTTTTHKKAGIPQQAPRGPIYLNNMTRLRFHPFQVEWVEERMRSISFLTQTRFTEIYGHPPKDLNEKPTDQDDEMNVPRKFSNGETYVNNNKNTPPI